MPRCSSQRGALHLGARPDAVEHAVAARDVLEVGLDLRLRRVAARPARVGLERELVEVRRHVAGRAGIGVVVPDAADALALLEHGDVVVAGAPQHHDRADAGEAAADDGDRGTVRAHGSDTIRRHGLARGGQPGAEEHDGLPAREGAPAGAKRVKRRRAFPRFYDEEARDGHPRRAAMDDDLQREAVRARRRRSATWSTTRSRATSSSAASGAAGACRRSHACSPRAARRIASCTCSTRSRACRRRPRRTSAREGRRRRSCSPRGRGPRRSGRSPTSRTCRAGMAQVDYPAERVHYHPGLVEDTIPGGGARADRPAAAGHRLVRLDQARARAPLRPRALGRRRDHRRLRLLGGLAQGG